MLSFLVFVGIAVAMITLVIVVRIFVELSRDETPRVTANIDCPLTWVVRSAGCIIPFNWQTEVENDQLVSVDVELVRYDPYTRDTISNVFLADIVEGDLELPTDDPRFFTESGKYKIQVIARSQLGGIGTAQHLFEYHYQDNFTYQDSVRRSQIGSFISQDRNLVRRGITFVGSGTLSSFPELPDKQIAKLVTCPKASMLSAIEYYDGYHIANGLPTNGVRLLKVTVRRLGSRDLLEEHDLNSQQTINYANPILIEEGIEILIEMRDPDNPSGSLSNSSADVKYHFVRVP